jgi:acetylornithine deacetylase/succinyl-diaminopimelate desuccinylase-like protein
VPIVRAELEALVSELIGIDSRNPWLIEGGAGEGDVARFLLDRLRALPVEVSVDEVEPGRPNVIARLRGSGGGPSLCLNAHLDTVGDASWPGRSMAPVVDGDHLVGLGAADDKGHCAVMLLVLESLVRRGIALGGDFVCAWTMDEEATSRGTQDLVARHRTDAAIVVEPFGIGRVTVTHQGFGWLDITVLGRAAHGSAPDVGIDAISRMAEVVGRLDRLERERFAAHPHPLNGKTVYHASTIRGGSDYATYPASCTLGIEIGTQPGETIDDRVREIEAIFDEIRVEIPDFEATVTVSLHREPFVAAGHEVLWDAIAAATRDVLGREPVAAGENAWMDAALMQSAGIATLSVGATGDHLHAPDEWVSIPELVAVGDILERTVADFCGPRPTRAREAASR